MTEIQRIDNVGLFQGIRERPYNQKALLEKVDWYSLKPTYVYFRELWLTQTAVQINALFGNQRFSHDPNIRVVVWKAECYLEDGHHRAVKAALLGKAELPARIYFANDLSVCNVECAKYNGSTCVC